MERIALGGDGWRLEGERSALGESAVAASLCRRTHYNAPRQIAVQSNATKSLLLLALLDLLVLCAGCRTTYRPTGTAPAKPAVSSLFDGLPPEIYRAWAAYVCAEPGEPRQQAAEQLLRILSQWGVGSPADPGLHARVELMSAVASAQARLDQETNACDRVPAAEEVIRLLKVGLDLPGWQSGELAQIKARFDEVQRLRDQALMEMRAEESYASVKNRENYARAIEALTDLAALCRRFAAADYYTVTDRDKWSRSARNFDQLRDQYVHEFEVALGALHQALEQAQKMLVFSRGLGVITTAAAVAVTVHSIEQTEQRYERRELTATQRGEQHGQAVGEFVLGCGGAIAGSFLGIPGGLPGMIGGGLAGGAAGSMAGAELGRTTLGRSLGGMYEAEEKQVSAAAGNFLRAAGPLTLNPEAYSGIGIGPATERALAGER